jgi:hypothetical protein
MSIVEASGPPLDPVKIRRGGYAVAIAGVAAGGAELFLSSAPTAAAAVVLAALSLAAALWTPELYEVTGRRGVRGFNPLLAAPACLVCVAGGLSHFLSVAPLVLAGVAGAVAAVGAAAFRWNRPGLAGRFQFAAVMALAGATLGYGAPALADVRFDAAPAQAYRATVDSMHVKQGRGATFYLQLAPWGPLTDENTVTVSRSLYNQLNPRDQVCIGLHPGLLGMPWFDVRLCPPPS